MMEMVIARTTEGDVGILPVVLGLTVRDHIAEGEFVASRFDLETPFGRIEVFDRCRVVNGLLAELVDAINAVHRGRFDVRLARRSGLSGQVVDGFNELVGLQE